MIAERFHFYRRIQAPGETVHDFQADLRKVTINCEFGNILDALRDRLVCGIRNDQAQKELLSEVGLTLTRALQTALFIEAAEARAKEMKGDESSILRVSSTCYRCGKPGHEQKSCRYKLSATSSVKLDIFCLLVDRKERRYQQDNKWVEVGDSAPPMDTPANDTNGLSLFAIGEATRDSSIKSWLL